MADSKIPAEIIKAAKETYDLEVTFEGLSDVAVSKAIEAGMTLYERSFLESIAREAELYAEECNSEDSDEDGISPYSAGLQWFAEKIRHRIPVNTTTSYEPKEGDIIEVVVLGPVAVYEDLCEHCGEENSTKTWSVYDNRSEREFFFEGGDEKVMNVKLIDNAPADS